MEMIKPSGLLFDADGTLIDTHDIILASMRHTVCDRYGFRVHDDILMRGVGTPLLDQMLYFSNGDEVLAKDMVDTYRKHNDSIHDANIKAFPGTYEALERLSAMGYKMGIVTSKRHEMAKRGLELSGILDFFEFIIGSDDWPEHKPHPGPILHGCDLLGLPSANCMYVGDSPYDIEAGNAAGCVTVAALWGMFPKEELTRQHPNIECKTIGELAALLDIGSFGASLTDAKQQSEQKADER